MSANFLPILTRFYQFLPNFTDFKLNRIPKKNIFLSLAQNPANLVILTQRAPENTIAGQLFADPAAESVIYSRSEAVPLQGEELEEFLQFQKEEEIENTLRENNVKTNINLFIMCLGCFCGFCFFKHFILLFSVFIAFFSVFGFLKHLLFYFFVFL